MKYLYLAIAIFFEVIASSLIKASDGFTKLVPGLCAIAALIISFYSFSIAVRLIPLSIAYASWAGLGIILTALVSVFIFKQALDFPAVAGMTLIIVGVLVINLFSKTVVR